MNMQFFLTVYCRANGASWTGTCIYFKLEQVQVMCPHCTEKQIYELQMYTEYSFFKDFELRKKIKVLMRHYSGKGLSFLISRPCSRYPARQRFALCTQPLDFLSCMRRGSFWSRAERGSESLSRRSMFKESLST